MESQDVVASMHHLRPTCSNDCWCVALVGDTVKEENGVGRLLHHDIPDGDPPEASLPGTDFAVG